MVRTFDDTGAALSRRVWIICSNVLAIAAVLLVLHQTRAMVAWILIALLLALALEPLVRWLERWRLPRGWAIAITALGVVASIGLLIATALPMLIDQGRGLVASIPDMLERLRGSRAVAWADERFDVIDRVKEELAENAGSAAGPLVSVVGGAFTGVIGVITISALTLFMLAFGARLFESSLEWIEPRARDRYRVLARRMHRTVGAYVNGSLLIALIGGVVTAVTLAILGVPYFLALGLAMTLLGLLPFIGSAIGGVLVVGAAFLTAGSKAGIIALVVFLVYQQIEGNLLQPIVQRKTIQMNALLIALVLLVGTSLAGVLGALLSLPIAAATQVALQDVLQRRQARWTRADATLDTDVASESDGIVQQQRAVDRSPSNGGPAG